MIKLTVTDYQVFTQSQDAYFDVVCTLAWLWMNMDYNDVQAEVKYDRSFHGRRQFRQQ